MQYIFTQKNIFLVFDKYIFLWYSTSNGLLLDKEYPKNVQRLWTFPALAVSYKLIYGPVTEYPSLVSL
jgi:hypothetical protein